MHKEQTVNGLTFTIREDWHETHFYNEDGERITDRLFVVVAQDATGYRWQSVYTHPSYASAKAEIRNLHRRNLAKLPIDGMDDHKGFDRIESCYGSDAWSQADEDNLRGADEWESDHWACGTGNAYSYGRNSYGH